MTAEFLSAYGGQTTDDLLAMAGKYRIDSLVLAFEQGIEAKAPGDVSTQESYVLAVEALEREVNNGGYAQFFCNSSGAFMPIIEAALRAIGCTKTAVITKDAIRALNLTDESTLKTVAESALLGANEVVQQALARCDERYFANDEPIADRLFDWIKVNKSHIRIGAA